MTNTSWIYDASALAGSPVSQYSHIWVHRACPERWVACCQVKSSLRPRHSPATRSIATLSAPVFRQACELFQTALFFPPLQTVLSKRLMSHMWIVTRSWRYHFNFALWWLCVVLSRYKYAPFWLSTSTANSGTLRAYLCFSHMIWC